MPKYFHCIHILLISLLFSFNTHSQNGTSDYPKAKSFASDQITVSEFMASNSSTIQDEDNDYSDWIELYNPTSGIIDLTNWYLTDDIKELTKWQFPSTQILSNGYLLVWASGKNKRTSGESLHANFKLSIEGENIILVKPDGSSIQFRFDIGYPAQISDISYGLINGGYFYLSKPTPGAANSDLEYLPETNYNVSRGIYNSPIDVTLTTTIPGGQIIYTIDGSLPALDNGYLYSGPVNISTTTPLRSAVFRGKSSSTVKTQTYFFLEDVIKQPNNPPGYPDHWGRYNVIGGTSIADYEMDPEVTQDPLYKDLLIKSFKSLPILSIVTNKDNFFFNSNDPETGGIYMNTGADGGYPGDGWGRPVSVEYLSNNPIKENFAVNCEVRIEGGQGRVPEKSPKHSLRLLFKSEYGPAKLNYPFFDDESATHKFNGLVLRAGFNNTWYHWESQQRDRAQYLRDAWCKDTQLAMKNPSAHSKYVHLFINGLYWGLYDVSERVDNDFLETYIGGNEADYDIIKDNELADGVLTNWVDLFSLVRKDMVKDTNCFKVLGQNADGSDNPSYPKYIDADNLIDYMLINFYGGNIDWDFHNWIAARNRTNPGKGFQFFCWDGEQVLINLNENVTKTYNNFCPSEILARLNLNQEFRMRFADRVQKHFYFDGALTPQQVEKRYVKRADEIRLALIAESARWGDYRRDVHRYNSGPYDLYTPFNQWEKEYNRLINEYFPYRTDIVLSQLQQKNLLSPVEAPVFSQYGGKVGDGYELTITAAEGEIFYTKDNTDPRKVGGNIDENAIMYNNNPVMINGKRTIKARALSNNIWSAMTEATFNELSVSTHVTSTISMTSGVYPNPFSDETILHYTLPEDGQVEVTIYSIDGKVIAVPSNEFQTAGKHFIRWNATGYSSGMYFYLVKCGSFRVSGKMIYLP
jgi:hypothetical protein